MDLLFQKSSHLHDDAMESVRLLIIGAGKMGAQHAEAFSNLANVELVGIVSKGGKSAKGIK